MLDKACRDKCPSCDCELFDIGTLLISCRNCFFSQYLTIGNEIDYCYKVLSDTTTIGWYSRDNLPTIIWFREKSSFYKHSSRIELDFCLPFDITINRLNKILLLK